MFPASSRAGRQKTPQPRHFKCLKLCFAPSCTAAMSARFILHLPDSSLAADSAPVTEPGCVRSRGTHTGMGLSSPPCAGTGTVAPQAPAGLARRWSRMGFSPETQAWAESLRQLSWVLPRDLPCPHTNLTPAVPGLTGCLCRQPPQAEPSGAPQAGRGPLAAPVSPWQNLQPLRPPQPRQRCRIKCLQHFAGGRGTLARH